MEANEDPDRSRLLRDVARVVRVQVGKTLARELRAEYDKVTTEKSNNIHRHGAFDEDAQENAAEVGIEPLRADAKLLNDLTKLVMQYSTSFTGDLIAFAKHGKRKQVHVNDVLLCARKSVNLQERLKEAIAKRNKGATTGDPDQRAAKRAKPEKSDVIQPHDRNGSDVGANSDDSSGDGIKKSSARKQKQNHAKSVGTRNAFVTASVSNPVVVDPGGESSDGDDVPAETHAHSSTRSLNLGKRGGETKKLRVGERRKPRPQPRPSKMRRKRGRVQSILSDSDDDSDFD